MTTAILLFGHGSRIPEANQTLYAIADMVREQLGSAIVEVSFGGRQAPGILDGIERCLAHGARRILLSPYFLSAGAHVLKELPAQLAEARRRHPGLEMTLGQPLGAHPKLAEVVCERIAEALGAAGWHD